MRVELIRRLEEKQIFACKPLQSFLETGRLGIKPIRIESVSLVE
jgi:hypothetical protein